MSITTMHYDTKTSTKINDNLTLADHVKNAIDLYYKDMVAKDLTPESVYNLVMSEIEMPLIETTMKYTKNNQYKSAKILGLNRGTFRKKLKHYGML